MAKVFAIDVLECPRCKSRIQRISFVQDSKAVRDILKSLGMATAPPLVLETDNGVVEYVSHQDEYTTEGETPPTDSRPKTFLYFTPPLGSSLPFPHYECQPRALDKLTA